MNEFLPEKFPINAIPIDFVLYDRVWLPTLCHPTPSYMLPSLPTKKL